MKKLLLAGERASHYQRAIVGSASSSWQCSPFCKRSRAIGCNVGKSPPTGRQDRIETAEHRAAPNPAPSALMSLPWRTPMHRSSESIAALAERLKSTSPPTGRTASEVPAPTPGRKRLLSNECRPVCWQFDMWVRGGTKTRQFCCKNHCKYH